LRRTCSGKVEQVKLLLKFGRKPWQNPAKGLKRLYEAGEKKEVPPSLAEKIADILLAIDEAQRPQDVGLFPGWCLHAMKGDLKGIWSVSVTGNWRVIFCFEKGDAFDVDLVDYH
jgi:proteic killer suppression protein